jgi:hypothetical protein
MSMDRKWEEYEKVAAHLLHVLRREFGLERVEGKQHLVGKDTGTEWEVDAKGILEDGEGFVLIECRRYTKSKQSQERVAALAFRIQDTGASGGIIVSPLGLQQGAAKVAQSANIISVEIDANSTPENFAVRFLTRLFMGVTDTIRVSDKQHVTVMRACGRCGVRFGAEADEKLCPECKRAAHKY